MNQLFAGIDIGGTKIAIALASPSGAVVTKCSLPTRPELGPRAIIENVASAIDELCSENDAVLVSIGIGSPAPIDVERGLIMSPSNLRDWVDFPIVDLLAKRFRVPVLLENDANAAALGEHMYGAGRGHKSVFYVTVSTGIGGGIIIDGEVYRGVCTAAGEIGHTIIQPGGVKCNCGSVGCLETICSGTHIVRRTNERLARGENSAINEMISDGRKLTAEMVIEAVRRNDKLAVEIWDETLRYLAIGVANAITLLAPEIVVIGGGIAEAGPLLFDPLRRSVPSYVSMLPADKVNIVPAELGKESGLHGALAIADKAYSASLVTYAV
jgi:glucokinase